MYCAYCGEKLKEEADVCLKCGKLVRNNSVKKQEIDNSIPFGVLGFFLPIVGSI